MVLIIFFVLWMLWFELLCFIVILKSVDSIPAFTLLLPPTWIVPEGCRAASIPFAAFYGFNPFLTYAFVKELLCAPPTL
jgi:hypothetical protein